jgi:transcriptional regulator
MSDTSLELPQGTLDLLILKTLALRPLHGWGITLRIQQMSHDAVQVPQGSLYPALHRLERRGLVKSQWGASENNRRARYYDLTPAGGKRLAAEEVNWERLVAAVSEVLGTA